MPPGNVVTAMNIFQNIKQPASVKQAAEIPYTTQAIYRPTSLDSHD
jgi:hypothetical protein